MKQFFALLSLVFSLSFTQAQSVDDIINLNTTAMGGKDKLASLKSVKMSGSMSARGNDIPLSISKLQMKGFRLDLEMMGTAYYQIVNNTAGWTFMPGMPEAKEMPADQLTNMSGMFDIPGGLFDYKAKGSTAELLGKEKLEAGEAYKIKLINKSGKSTVYFIDAATNRLIKVQTKISFNGQDIDAETSFGDYKQNKDGYWFPYSVTSRQGVTVFDSIDTNIPMDEKLFTN